MHVNSSGMSDEPLAGISMGFTMTSPRHKRTVTGAFPSETTSCSRETTIYIYIYWLVVSNMFYCPWHLWDNPSHWLIFFKMVKTTNQYIYTRVFISYVLICLFVDVHSGWWIDLVWFCMILSRILTGRQKKRRDSHFWTTNKSTYANGTSNWLFRFSPENMIDGTNEDFRISP